MQTDVRPIGVVFVLKKSFSALIITLPKARTQSREILILFEIWGILP